MATDTQKIYRDNGTSWDTVATAGGTGGTITGVTAGTGLSGGGSSGSVTVNLASIANNSILANTSGSSAAPVSTTLTTLLDTLGSVQGSVLYRGSSAWSVLAPGTNGQYLQTQGTSANPQWASVSVSGFSGSLAGDVSGAQSSTSVDKIKGKSVVPVAYSSAQVLRYDGTNWVNATLSSADLSNDSNLLKASNMPANCSASQALTFSSPTGSWACSNIAGLDAGVITTGTIASARLPASATYWSAATGGINYASGNVGVGTASPAAKLEVAGEIRPGSTGVACSSTNSGAMRYNSAVPQMEYCDGTAWQPVGPPVGSVSPFAGATAPAGWIICDGSAVSRTTYANLFNVIGTTYGAGDGSTTFNLPDLRGRIPVGAGQGSGLTNRALATNGGTELVNGSVTTTVSLTTAVGANSAPSNATPYVGTSGAGTGLATIYNSTLSGPVTMGGVSTTAAGFTGDLVGTDANMQPYTTLNYIIKY